MLILNPTSRRRFPVLMFALVLGSAVFFWGLGYKLSLYHSVAANHSEPAARLLSQKERPTQALHLEALFRGGNSPHHSGTQTLSPTGLTSRKYIHPRAAGARIASTLPSTPLPLQPQRISGSSPRAPPIAA